VPAAQQRIPLVAINKPVQVGNRTYVFNCS
jgi:hypothetical protein